MLELDILLQPFVADCYDALTLAQRRSLQELLNLDDVELLELVRRPPDAGKFKELVQAILNHRRETQSPRDRCV